MYEARRAARKSDIALILDFSRKIPCPICRCWLRYKTNNRQAYCNDCKRQWNAVDYLICKHHIHVDEAVKIIISKGSAP